MPNSESLVYFLQGGDHPWVGAELEIVVELGNLVPRKNLVSQKVFFDFEVFTELNSKNVSEITAKIICFA